MTSSKIQLKNKAQQYLNVVTSNRLVKTVLKSGLETIHHRSPRQELINNPRTTHRPPQQAQTMPSYPAVGSDADPLTPEPSSTGPNPVLTSSAVSDFGAVDDVADPFLFPGQSGNWHLFFEVYNSARTPTAAIGHAVSTGDGNWEYDRIVLESDEHLSFPYVFKWQSTHFMVPDEWTKDPDSPAPVTIYQARNFPYDWEPVSVPLSPVIPLHDCVLFRWEGRWWAIAGKDGDIHVYYSDELEAADWNTHDANPVVSNRESAGRPGGRPIVRDEYVLLFLQDCQRKYGAKLRAFQITDLTPSSYTDEELPESPVLEASPRRIGWRSGRMHHMDAWYAGDRWVCAVDGNASFGTKLIAPHLWSIGMYQDSG